MTEVKKTKAEFIGAEFRRLRKEKGLRVKDIAHLFGLTLATITRMESHGEHLTIGRFFSLCDVFDVDPLQMIEATMESKIQNKLKHQHARDELLNRQTKQVAVIACKGGSGRTHTVKGLALAALEEGKNIGIIDLTNADIHDTLAYNKSNNLKVYSADEITVAQNGNHDLLLIDTPKNYVPWLEHIAQSDIFICPITSVSEEISLDGIASHTINQTFNMLSQYLSNIDLTKKFFIHIAELETREENYLKLVYDRENISGENFQYQNIGTHFITRFGVTIEILNARIRSNLSLTALDFWNIEKTEFINFNVKLEELNKYAGDKFSNWKYYEESQEILYSYFGLYAEICDKIIWNEATKKRTFVA